MKVEFIHRNESYLDAYVDDDYVGPVGELPNGRWVNYVDGVEYIAPADAAEAKAEALTKCALEDDDTYCKVCYGAGEYEADDYSQQTCDWCNGTGVVYR